MKERDKGSEFKQNLESSMPILGLASFIFILLYFAGAITILSYLVFIVLFASGLLVITVVQKNDANVANNIQKFSEDTYFDYIVESLNSLPDALIIVNKKEEIIFYNTNAQIIFFDNKAFDSEDIIRLTSVIPSANLMNSIQEVREENISKKIDISLDEELFFETNIANALKGINNRNNEGEVVIYLKNITELKRLSKIRTEFISNASHELKTPISVILGLTETLLNFGDEDPKMQKKFLKKLGDEAERVQTLIEDLLSLNYLEMRENITLEEKVNLNLIIEEVAESLLILTKKEKINLKLSIPKDDTFIIGEQNDLRRAFLNLIENAIRYNNKNGDVIIELFTKDQNAILNIKDNGLGIDDIHLERLSERFYRVDPEDSKKKGGTGLGLSIVKHIANRHNAELKISSKIGEGTQVSLIFELL